MSLICCGFLAFGLGGRSKVAFKDHFNDGKLDTTKWIVATYKSPDSAPGVNAGTYVADALDFSQGMLRIKVQQQATADGVESTGGAILTKELFGFGTYEFEMRMSSNSITPHGEGSGQTGAVSSAFLYYNKSQTEIDLEYLANENAMWVSTWFNKTPAEYPTPLQKSSKKVEHAGLDHRFHRYTLVWSPKSVDVYIDGAHVSHQTEHVPLDPAHIILQHRGTNSDKWGGTASLGAQRYFYVRSVKFTPKRVK